MPTGIYPGNPLRLMDHIMLAILDHERGVKILLYTFIGMQFLELLTGAYSVFVRQLVFAH